MSNFCLAATLRGHSSSNSATLSNTHLNNDVIFHLDVSLLTSLYSILKHVRGTLAQIFTSLSWYITLVETVTNSRHVKIYFYIPTKRPSIQCKIKTAYGSREKPELVQPSHTKILLVKLTFLNKHN